ncbi:MAG: alpha/beta hydrolase [Acidobacteria bacterium]|nr:alpha/beta hydrolase [Acidobacteriota bacterium]
MNIIDRGSGTPIVVIPGIQGRWEWMTPAIDALARRCRVITFSLADEPSSGGRFDEHRGLQSYVDQVRDALDAAGLRQATICGVSYGGLIAAAFAARHPDRTSSLVLVSALPPSWRPDARVRFYLRAPRVLAPLFMLASLRMYREIAIASDGFIPGVATAAQLGWRSVTHMFSPSRMARRIRLLDAIDVATARASVAAPATPALIITGEPALDRVVPVSMTREYLQLWPGARVTTLARTGHLGSMTRPVDFADLVVPFVERVDERNDDWRQVG